MELDRYVESLNGISEQDWNKLKTGIDRFFHHQHVELQKEMKFHDSDLVKRFIRSQFG